MAGVEGDKFSPTVDAERPVAVERRRMVRFRTDFGALFRFNSDVAQSHRIGAFQWKPF